MVSVPQAADWLLLLFLFQISSTSAFYAEKGFAPIQQSKGNGVDSDHDTGSYVTDEGHALDGQAVGLPEEADDDIQSEKRRLGSALNIARGRGQKAMTHGKRMSEEGEIGDRFFQVYRNAALRGQPINNENKQLAQGYNEQEEEEVDRRNIGSAMNLIKVRKNDVFRISPLAEEEGDSFEEGRERRRLGAAMNLKKVKSRLVRD